MVSTKTTKKKVSSSKPSSSTSSCKYKKVGETKDSAHKCVYVKTGTGTGSGSDKTSKYYTASIVDKKKKYKVYHGELKRVQKGKGWGKQLGGELEGTIYPRERYIQQTSSSPTTLHNTVAKQQQPMTVRATQLRSHGGKLNNLVNNLNINEQQQVSNKGGEITWHWKDVSSHIVDILRTYNTSSGKGYEQYLMGYDGFLKPYGKHHAKLSPAVKSFNEYHARYNTLFNRILLSLQNLKTISDNTDLMTILNDFKNYFMTDFLNEKIPQRYDNTNTISSYHIFMHDVYYLEELQEINRKATNNTINVFIEATSNWSIERKKLLETLEKNRKEFTKFGTWQNNSAIQRNYQARQNTQPSQNNQNNNIANIAATRHGVVGNAQRPVFR
jgi:hypothetical protein